MDGGRGIRGLPEPSMIHECAFEIIEKEKRTKKGKFILVPKYKERDSSATAPRYLCYPFVSLPYYTLLCFVVSLSLSVFPVGHASLGQLICCDFGLCQCVPVIHGTVHLFSSPLNKPSQRSAQFHPQARTPAPSDLQLSCSFSNLELCPSVFSCLLLLFLCTHVHFLT